MADHVDEEESIKSAMVMGFVAECVEVGVEEDSVRTDKSKRLKH